MTYNLIIFSAFFIFTAFLNTSKAQNRVKVTQNGSGNTAIINQPNNTQDTDCHQSKKKLTASGSANQILIRKSAASADTILLWNGPKYQSISAIVDRLLSLSASQEGAANQLLITLPSDTNTTNTVKVHQRGSENVVSISPCESSDSKNS